MQAVVQGVSCKSTLGDDRDHRHTQLFQQHTHLPGQGRGSAVKGVAGLRVHQDAALFLFEQIFHICDEGHVGDEFLGRNTAKQPHQKGHTEAYKTVGGAHDAVGLGEEYFGGDLQVDEAGMVHQDQAGLFSAELFHSVSLIGKIGGKQIKNGQKTHHQLQKKQWPPGISVLGPGLCHNLFIGEDFGWNLHNLPPAFPDFFYCTIFPLARQISICRSV